MHEPYSSQRDVLDLTIPSMPEDLADIDYQRLLAFRMGLRRFLRWSEVKVESYGLTTAQHQLLLAIRGHSDPRGPTVGEAAAYLLLRHHSAVGLVDRAMKAGLVVRLPDEEDHRIVRLGLTEKGSQIIRQLTAQHLDELERLAPRMRALWTELDE
jgi:DNA-binding MarR family transcriptional regulator